MTNKWLLNQSNEIVKVTFQIRYVYVLGRYLILVWENESSLNLINCYLHITQVFTRLCLTGELSFMLLSTFYEIDFLLYVIKY